MYYRSRRSRRLARELDDFVAHKRRKKRISGIMSIMGSDAAGFGVVGTVLDVVNAVQAIVSGATNVVLVDDAWTSDASGGSDIVVTGRVLGLGLWGEGPRGLKSDVGYLLIGGSSGSGGMR